MSSDWRCSTCGPVPPLHVAEHINAEIVESVTVRSKDIPVWCPWPLPAGWMVTGIGWAGDERTGTRATALACSGPGPLGGPADIVLVAEEPGVGLGNRYAGLAGPDPGPYLQDALENTAAHAKVKAAGWPTALWAVRTPATGRSAYVGEAKGVWLYAIAWPDSAAYLFAEDLVLHDLTEWVPAELVYGAPSPYLHGAA
ncbi:MAG: hypothetical protein E6F99_15435 [Actinobacteria bacterium]|nr:MAG: hypothetical protein E6F99_15435 [Actinomycetota bacterium]